MQNKAQNQNSQEAIEIIIYQDETKESVKRLTGLLKNDKNLIDHFEILVDRIEKQVSVLNLASFVVVQPLLKTKFLDLLLKFEPKLLLDDREILISQVEYTIHGPLLIAVRNRNLSAINLVLNHSVSQEEMKKNPAEYSVKLFRAYMWATLWYRNDQQTAMHKQIFEEILKVYNTIKNQATEEQATAISIKVKRDYFTNVITHSKYCNIDDNDLIESLTSSAEELGISIKYQSMVWEVIGKKFKQAKDEKVQISLQELDTIIINTHKANDDIEKALKSMSIADKTRDTENYRG